MAESRRVVISGATGLIGRALCRELLARGYSLSILARSPGAARSSVPGASEYIAWQPEERGAWASTIDGAYAVVNMAGPSLAGQRWTAEYKRFVRDTRIIGTRGLVNAIAQAGARPQVFVSASAVGYYGYRDDTPLDERSAPGGDFLAQLCQDWEREAIRAEEYGVRSVLLRTGIVLDRSEGALPQLMLPFSLFVGGPILPGTQWLSWIHWADELGIIMLALEHPEARGPINATAPEPQRNRDFARALGLAMGRPWLMPVPSFALQLMVGEFSESLTHGQRVLPRAAQALGYQFRYPKISQALGEILGGVTR